VPGMARPATIGPGARSRWASSSMGSQPLRSSEGRTRRGPVARGCYARVVARGFLTAFKPPGGRTLRRQVASSPPPGRAGAVRPSACTRPIPTRTSLLSAPPLVANRSARPQASISLAVPGRLMRSLVAEGPETPYGVRDRTGPRTAQFVLRLRPGQLLAFRREAAPCSRSPEPTR
jgi:hypothetical protein